MLSADGSPAPSIGYLSVAQFLITYTAIFVDDVPAFRSDSPISQYFYISLFVDSRHARLMGHVARWPAYSSSIRQLFSPIYFSHFAIRLCLAAFFSSHQAHSRGRRRGVASPLSHDVYAWAHADMRVRLGYI